MPGGTTGTPVVDPLVTGGGGTTGLPVAPGLLVTYEEGKAYLEIVREDNDELVKTITERIAATQGNIQDMCGRRFTLSEGEARKLWPNIKGTVDLIDLLDDPAPTVYIDSQNDRTYTLLVEASSYEFFPFDNDPLAAARYQELAYIGPSRGFNTAYPVKVTGSWGWVEPDGRAPYEIRLAILMLLARWWKRKELPLNVMQMPLFGFKRLMDQDPDVAELIKPFIHIRKKRTLQ